MMCNGATFDEVLFNIHGLIDRFGWAVVPVGHQLSSTWAYTIGLVEVNHPELTVVGMAPERAARLLNRLAVPVDSEIVSFVKESLSPLVGIRVVASGKRVGCS